VNFIIKLLFVIVPATILATGVILFSQAIRFWSDIVGPPKVEPVALTFDQPADIVAVAFVPSSIRPELTPVELEVEISLVGQAPDQKDVSIEVEDRCNYVRIEQSKTNLVFDDSTPHMQPAKSQLLVRNSRPSPSCDIIITVQIDDAIATASKTLPIDGWTGHLLAVGKMLTGLLSSGLGLAGVFGLLFGP